MCNSFYSSTTQEEAIFGGLSNEDTTRQFISGISRACACLEHEDNKTEAFEIVCRVQEKCSAHLALLDASGSSQHKSDTVYSYYQDITTGVTNRLQSLAQSGKDACPILKRIFLVV